MAVTDLDVILRVAGATLLIWAAFGGGGRRTTARRLFVPLAVCLVGFLAGNTPDPGLRLSGFLGRVCVILAGYAAVFLWWWCLAVFDRGFRPSGLVLAIGLAWVAVASADRGLLGPVLADQGLSWILIVFGLIMVTHLAWRLIRDRPDDLVERRRSARALIVVTLAAQLLADLVVDIVLGFEWSPRGFTIAQNAAFLASTAWLLSLDLTANQTVSQVSEQSTPAPHRPVVDAPDSGLVARLNELVEVERVHLNPDLTFEQFVAAMGASERVVRRLINQQMGYDHFRTFLNAHRVAEAKRRLMNADHDGDKLIAIALDSGFASLASFNRVYRDREGHAPGTVRTVLRSGFEERSVDF